MLENRIAIDVQFGDCDPIGIVYYPNYFRWFDLGFTRLMASAGLAPSDLFRNRGIRFPLVDVGARFSAPAAPDDRLDLTTSVVECRNKTVHFVHRLSRNDTLCLEGHEVRVWAKASPDGDGSLKADHIPDDIRAILSATSDRPI